MRLVRALSHSRDRRGWGACERRVARKPVFQGCVVMFVLCSSCVLFVSVSRSFHSSSRRPIWWRHVAQREPKPERQRGREDLIDVAVPVPRGQLCTIQQHHRGRTKPTTGGVFGPVAKAAP